MVLIIAGIAFGVFYHMIKVANENRKLYETLMDERHRRNLEEIESAIMYADFVKYMQKKNSNTLPPSKGQ